MQTATAWRRSQLTAATRHARRRMLNVEGWRPGAGARSDRPASGKRSANRAGATPRAGRCQSSLCQSWRRRQGRTSSHDATVRGLHEPDICHPPALRGALHHDSQLSRRRLRACSRCSQTARRLQTAHATCFADTRQLIQGLQATAPQLVVPGTWWRIERRASSPALLRRRSSCYSCPTGRTPLSPFPKLAAAALAASVPRHDTKASRSWMLEKLRCTSVHHAQPPTWFCPAAAVCRVSYLVLGDIHAVSVALGCTAALITSDYTPLSTEVQPAAMSWMLLRCTYPTCPRCCAASVDSDISGKSNHKGTVPPVPGRVQVRSSSSES